MKYNPSGSAYFCWVINYINLINTYEDSKLTIVKTSSADEVTTYSFDGNTFNNTYEIIQNKAKTT